MTLHRHMDWHSDPSMLDKYQHRCNVTSSSSHDDDEESTLLERVETDKFLFTKKYSSSYKLLKK